MRAQHMAVMLTTNEFAVHKILRYQYGLYKRKKVLFIYIYKQNNTGTILGW